MIKISRAAKRYVKAFFEWSKEKGKLARAANDMHLILKTLESSPELDRFLKNPTVGTGKKSAVLQKLFAGKIDEQTFRLLDILAKHDRLDILDQIAVLFDKFHKEYEGVVEAELVTAVPVDDTIKENFLETVKKISGKDKVDLSVRTDESLLGGYVLKIGDMRIDDSIKGKLNKIKQQLKHL